MASRESNENTIRKKLDRIRRRSTAREKSNERDDGFRNESGGCRVPVQEELGGKLCRNFETPPSSIDWN